MKAYRNWLLGAVALTICILIGTAALVVYIDPFFHYHAPLQNFPYQVDNQLSQNPGMAEHMTYDSAILGSSMTVNFNTTWFAEEMGLQTLKLSYNGAYPKDQANIMSKIYASDNQIDAIFLGVDVINYSADAEETKYPIPEYLYDDNYLNDIQYVLNKDVLLNYILRQVASPVATDLSTVYASWWTDDYYNIQWVMHNYTSPEWAKEELPRDYFIPGIEANLNQNIKPYIDAHPETTFYVFYPPYSILFWDDAIKNRKVEATLREYEYITQELMPYDNVRIFFFPNQDWIVTDLNHYADYTHYHPDINHYMTECFGNGACEIKTTEELEQALEQMRDIVETFDFDTLFAADWN